ncbi:DNA polymerase I, partial [Candidatus Peregrinibacteria bacterium]|nr:DNA polymerase I [Candidatus Peregrinibacteria bacterium]
ASDNIPGVKGIGEKQAIELLQKYQTLDNLYAHLNELKPGQQTKLVDNRETAYLSQRMATIIRDMPIQLDLESCHLHTFPIEKARHSLTDLGFNTLMRNLNELELWLESRKQAEKQPTLF